MPFGPPAVAALLLSAFASASDTSRDDLDDVWYMFVRSSSDAGVALGPGFAPAPSLSFGRVPGCKDCRPRGVSRMTRKWPVNGGANVAGRVSGSTYTDCLSVEQVVS